MNLLHAWLGLARQNDPETAKEAARSIKPASLEVMVLEAIKSAPEGCTADEVAYLLPAVSMNSLTPRFSSLLRRGLVIDTGKRRKGRSGRDQRVLYAA